MQRHTTSSRAAQRGAASLIVALMLLLAGTVMAFFANRGFIFEQRTSANQYRATKAFELAEAGAEWAIGKFNEGMPLVTGSSCATGAGVQTFRERYATPVANATGGRLNIDTALRPRCRIPQTGAPVCDCQTTAGTLAALGAVANDQGHFGVRFAAVPGDDTAVEIIARGCTSNDAVCDPGTASSSAEATALVRVIAKVVPALPVGPGAPLTAGSLTVSGGNLTVVNTDGPSNGITIHAGAGVSTGTRTTVYSVPGSAPGASIVDNDAALDGITTGGAEDAFFARYFGQTLSHYSNADGDVIRISGCSAAVAAACGAQITSYLAQGLRNPRFYVAGDVTFDSRNTGGAVGSAAAPVVIVASGALNLSAAVTAYGVFYAGTTNISGSDTATLYGASISRTAFNKSGSGVFTLVYDPSLWSRTTAPAGRLVRVPGSWRDKAAEY